MQAIAQAQSQRAECERAQGCSPLNTGCKCAFVLLALMGTTCQVVLLIELVTQNEKKSGARQILIWR
jgi:hypothetical protein